MVDWPQALTVLGIVVWTRTSGTLAVAASASRVPLAVTLGVLLVIIANARITAAEDLDALYGFACAKLDFLERELERGLSRTERSSSPAFSVWPSG